MWPWRLNALMPLAVTVAVTVAARVAIVGDSPAAGTGTGGDVDAEFFVSLRGNDTHSGTEQDPFRTLQRCLQQAPGAPAVLTCTLEPGRYTEAAAVPARPGAIVIRGNAATVTDSKPAVLDGSRPLALKWSRSGADNSHSNDTCVYRSERLAADWTPWQLWVGDEDTVLTPARWPNARLHDMSAFAPLAPNGSGPVSYSDKSSTAGRLVDAGRHVPSVADCGIDFTDTILVMPIGTMGTDAGGVLVERHGRGSSTISYAQPPGTAGKGHTNVPFFFEGHPKLLDAEYEWAYDASARQLLFWPPACADPNAMTFRGKVHNYVLNASNAQLTLANLTLFGGTISSENVQLSLDTVRMAYPSFNTRSVSHDSLLDVAVTKVTGAKSTIRMTNSTVMFHDGNGALFPAVGQGAVFSNNMFVGCNYAFGDTCAVGDHNSGSGMLFERNTISFFNSFAGVTPALVSTVRLNLFQFQGPEVDGAAVHVHIASQNGAVLEQNWAHDLAVKAYRFDRMNTPTAHWGENGTVVRNVAWNTGSLTVKGDRHVVENNLVFHSSDDFRGAIDVMEYDASIKWSIKGENAHTRMAGNAADSLFNVSGRLPGLHSNNLGDVGVAAQLMGPDGRDFRPRPGTLMARMGAGAYPVNGTGYWIPGKQGVAASAPVPAAGSVAATLPAGDGGGGRLLLLAWRGAYQATGHQLLVRAPDAAACFGSKEVPAIAGLPVRVDLPSGQTSHLLPVGDPATGCSLVWRVDALFPSGRRVEGPAWHLVLGA